MQRLTRMLAVSLSHIASAFGRSGRNSDVLSTADIALPSRRREASSNLSSAYIVQIRENTLCRQKSSDKVKIGWQLEAPRSHRRVASNAGRVLQHELLTSPHSCPSSCTMIFAIIGSFPKHLYPYQCENIGYLICWEKRLTVPISC